MGFTIHAESTEAVAPDRAEAIVREASKLVQGRSWLSCEPPLISLGGPSGADRLFCFFKPNFSPHPRDVEAAEASGEPDGALGDAIEILARVSRDHGVDWEIGADEFPEPVGYIRGGTVDDAIPDVIESLEAMAEAIAEFDPDADE